ncbi:MAG: ABC transporter permease [Bryobacterales bacterium]|nr:ABC transporter permease [Bryobacterales bacterium]
MANLRHDLRYALRLLRRTPGLTITALACLGLGIGATSAIFSVVNAVVLRPLPFKDSQNLARLYSEWPTWPGGGMWRFWISPPEFEALRRDLQTVDKLDAWQTGGANLSPSGIEPVRVNIAQVTGTLMPTLGVAPIRGRVLEPADAVEGAPLTIVLSYGLWQGAFGGTDNAIGRNVVFNGVNATIVGVMPRSFQFPPGEATPAELWAPLQIATADRTRWASHRLSVVARLKPGASIAQLNQDLNRIENEYGNSETMKHHRPNPKNHTLMAFSLLDETVGNVRPAMLLMLGATALVLLIACGNVANLLLARAQTRQREVAVRQSMGASPWGLLRQFLLEGLVLSVGGALLGLGLAFGILKLILTAGADSIPRADEVTLDASVFLVALACAVFTGIVFGLAPLAQIGRTKLSLTLKSGTRTTATREAHWLRNSLVIGELSLAMMLLAGAGLLLNTFWKLVQTDPGIRADGVLSMRISLPQQNYAKPPDVQRFWRETLERTSRLPGVTNVAIMGGLPPLRPINANDTYIEGLVQKPGGPMHNVDYWNVASPALFETLGVQLVKGRLFDARDTEGAPPTLIVNETFERTFYPGDSAIGRRVKPNGGPKDDTPWFTLVGVVRDIKNQGLDQRAGTELFFPAAQAGANLRSAALLVKGTGDPWRHLGPVRDTIRGLDAALPLAQVRPLEEAISTSRARPRFLAMLLSLFAAVALGLAAIGIFSVMMYAVAQRTNEFGVRMALGAAGKEVLGLVLKEGMRLVAAGIVIGGAGGWALLRVLRGTVPGLAEVSIAPLLATVVLLILVMLAACLTPARRATRVDPSTALRAD